GAAAGDTRSVMSLLIFPNVFSDVSFPLMSPVHSLTPLFHSSIHFTLPPGVFLFFSAGCLTTRDSVIAAERASHDDECSARR
ncbi:hypothetical protein DFH29DRAFT_932680, partial [Suillus ampliporus]